MKIFLKSCLFKWFVAVCLLLSANAWVAAQITVTGTVSDQGGPLPGVNVLVKGTQNGIMTGVDGKYSLSIPNQNAVLVFSYIGYTTKEETVGNRTVVNVEMEEDVLTIDEVVVVGYGVMRKSDLTGAVTSVSSEKLQDRPVANMLDALQGKAAGVDITSSSRPGELGSVRIRGERSITATSGPLYVIDGIPLIGRSNANVINSDDIKSLEILKDASATSIYGSRGANGVILITTNRGEEGRFSINYSGSFSVSTVQDAAARNNAGEYIDLLRWSYYYTNPNSYPRGDQPTFANDLAILNGDPYAFERNVANGWGAYKDSNGEWVTTHGWDPSKVKTTDWTKFVSRTGMSHNHTVNISGGTARVTANVSIGYLNEQGTALGQEYNRYTINSNVTIKPKDWFELGLRMSGNWQVQEYGLDSSGDGSFSTNSGGGDIYDAALRLYPHALPFDDDGNRIIWPGGIVRRRTIVDEEKYTRNMRETLNFMPNLHVQVKLPIDGLTFRTEFGTDFRYYNRGSYISPESVFKDGATTNSTSLSNNRDFSWTVNNLLMYQKQFGIHRLDITLGQTADKNEQISSSIGGTDTPYPPALWNGFASSMIGSGVITSASSSTSIGQTAGYLGRVLYNLNDRYLLQVNGRYDGASQLAPGNKWNFFPSGSLAWRLDQEDFIKSVTWINQLKMRLGYGLSGSASVGRYATKGPLSRSIFPYGTSTVTYYTVGTALANQELTWEKTRQWNLGIDFSVLKSRITGQLELYSSYTYDLILSSNIPTLTGYQTTTSNVGATSNKGVELQTTTLNFNTPSGFRWETNFNISYQKNKIEELSLGKVDEVANSRFIGAPISISYGLKYVGIWRDTPEDLAEMAKFNEVGGHGYQPGDIRVADLNGDYVISNNDDRMILGQSRPNWISGMTNVFSYKGIELLVGMNGRFGSDYITTGNNPSLTGYYLDRKVDYYTEANKDSKFWRPRYDGAGVAKDQHIGAASYCKASFITLRNVSLSYRVPRRVIQNWIGMQSLRIYAQCNNVGNIYSACDFKNMDVNSSIWERRFVFGLQVGF